MPFIPLSDLREQSSLRPAGYLDAVISAGKIVGDCVELSDAAYASLCDRYRLPEPSLAEMLSSFTTSITRWAKEGFPVADEATFAARLAKCRSCPEHTETALGLRCRLCGCYGLKLWLSTEKCPLKKW